jgi:hypothetical protein
MNFKQLIIAAIVGVIMLAMLIYPPFESVLEHGKFNLGYEFILTPPDNYGTVNIGLLLMQWAVVIVIGAIGWLFLKNKD